MRRKANMDDRAAWERLYVFSVSPLSHGLQVTDQPRNRAPSRPTPACPERSPREGAGTIAVNASLVGMFGGARLSACQSLVGSPNSVRWLPSQVFLAIQSWTFRQANLS